MNGNRGKEPRVVPKPHPYFTKIILFHTCPMKLLSSFETLPASTDPPMNRKHPPTWHSQIQYNRTTGMANMDTNLLHPRGRAQKLTPIRDLDHNVRRDDSPISLLTPYMSSSNVSRLSPSPELLSKLFSLAHSLVNNVDNVKRRLSLLQRTLQTLPEGCTSSRPRTPSHEAPGWAHSSGP